MVWTSFESLPNDSSCFILCFAILRSVDPVSCSEDEMSATNKTPNPPPPNMVHHTHVVQFYTEDRFLLDELSHFIGAALAAGSSAVVIATSAHEDCLSERLTRQGVDLGTAIADGRYVALDAAETLSRLMVGGVPHAALFAEILGGVISRAASAARDENHRVVAFGEMVALLWAEGKSEAAIVTEKLWNQLARAYSFSLRCAYPMQGFCREEHADTLLRICDEHTGVVPSEGYSELTSEEERLRSVVRLQQQMQVLLSEVDARRKEEQFRLFAEAVADYAIFMTDPEGRVTTWNAGAERMRGYKASEILGQHISCFYPADEVLSGAPQKLLDRANQEGHVEDEGWRVRKDGTTFWANVIIAALRNEAGKLIGFGNVTRDLTERRRAETALRRSEDRFRLMTEAVQDYAIFMLDPEGHVSTWNTGAKRIKGYNADEIIGRHFSCFYPEEDIRAGKPARELVDAVQHGRFEDEGWRLRKDGSAFWANVIITPVRDETNKLIGFAKVTRDVTDRMQKEKSLRDLTGHLLQMQDEERRRIGRDLHDTLGQCVTAMKINLDSLASSLETKDTAVNRQVTQCVNLAEECVKEVRTLSYLLYPPMLEEMGLKSAIPWYVEGFTARSGIQVTFDASADFGRLSRDTELALFRVLQESLTNVHRHSGSRTAHVQLSSKGGMAILEVRDDGKGIPSTILEESGDSWYRIVGVGLRGMKQRLAQLGGKLEIASGERGAVMTATVPALESDGALSNF
jgi:PAS domain S-box-containing protein